AASSRPCFTPGGGGLMARTPRPKYDLHIDAPVNGKIGTATFRFTTKEGETVYADKADVQVEKARDQLSQKAAKKLKVPLAMLRKQVETECNRLIDDARKQQAAAGEGEEAAEGDERVSAATLLVQLASATNPELFHSPDGTAFARVRVEDHWEVWALRTS